MRNHGTVLVVDDNVDLLESLSSILVKTGYDVDMAEDGWSAVEKIKEHPFDVILMDIVMPRMNGVEAFRKIRQINPGARVALMTAYYDEGIINDLLKEGLHSALGKPVDIDYVIEMVGSIVSSPSILIVDDNPDFCQTMAKLLDAEGYRVHAAYSGEEAVEIAKHKVCQLAFVDVKLPFMNGLETHLKLKELHPSIMTVMVTAYRDEVQDIMQKALADPATTCLYKPFDPSEAMALVSRTCARLPNWRCQNS